MKFALTARRGPLYSRLSSSHYFRISCAVGFIEGDARRLSFRRQQLTVNTDHAVTTHPPFVDIHCHIVPSIDDGSKSWDESLAMARMAAGDGTEIIIATPHQLGSLRHNTAKEIRHRVDQLNATLEQQ